MASVGATIANRGVRHRPRLVRSEKRAHRRVVKPRVAQQVRDMMLEVVRSGTGTAAALPGVEVAGKTGTAELVPTADQASNPANTDAWFVAFAPASSPRRRRRRDARRGGPGRRRRGAARPRGARRRPLI